MAKVIYLSPSNHGTGANKCLKSGCYEDKHTRPMAEAAAKYLEYNGFKVHIAKKGTSMTERCKESDKVGADMHVPIHTNAAGSSARYLMFMCLKTSGEYKKMFDAISPYLEAIYPNKKEAVFVSRTDLFEINKPKAKTFYCEMGFHTNKTDVEKFIHNPDAIGKALAKGICKYYGVTFKESGSSSTSKPTSTSTSSSKLTVDGDWGTKTTKKTQKVLGTEQDGIVSGQLNSCRKYLGNCQTSSWKFGETGKGSAMVRAIQKLVGADSDGFCGKKTVIAMQKFLKKKGFDCGDADGYMEEKTVEAWQKYINSRM